MAAPFPNVYHLRTVAETSSKPCLVCYKPTCKVLITPNNKDFFYTCVGHLSDAGFASPVVDAEAEAAKKKKELMDKEIEKVKQEYEERQRLKKSKKKSKDDDKDQDNSKAEKERDEKIKAIQSGGESKDQGDDTARIYALHRHFYQIRLDKLRNLEVAKRNQQRLNTPGFFPSTPKGDFA
ncbi:hypothetical protein B0A52_06600 [Exophiala mesophila]|uniref:DUF1742-domain-containing protein n=1 Tax=Exophiala mesophila TaxID=212818 RepID=A0A438N1H9_EXOME|nr:hypothetical protein B0A52_06600 [Exophiala mesophila]